MNIENRLRVPQQEQEVGQQKSPEEVLAEQERAEHAPESEQVEQQEGKESLESRYDRLAKEALGIKRDREITFQLSDMQSEGLQTLVGEYGADAVFSAIKKQFELKAKIIFPLLRLFVHLNLIKIKEMVSTEKCLATQKDKPNNLNKDLGEKIIQNRKIILRACTGVAKILLVVLNFA